MKGVLSQGWQGITPSEKPREREHAVRNGLKAGGGNDGGKPNAQLAVKSKGLLKVRGTKTGVKHPGRH